MSVLTVSNVTHGFGARQILDDASFRLLKGEHVGLIGANGEGKSTFLNIITGKLPPDEGKIEWSNQVTVGYLDQHAVLEKGMTTVLWSVDSLDWKLRNTNRVVKRVLKDVEDGDIILMHDIFPTSVEAPPWRKRI